MKKAVKILALILALIMCVSCFVACGEDKNSKDDDNDGDGGNVEAGETNGGNGGSEKKPSEGLEFELNADGNSYSVVGIGTCTDTEIVIPSTHEGKPVTRIGNGAFQDESAIKSIVIPEGVKIIDEAAFWGCKRLEKINIPNSITRIGPDVFNNCTALKYNKYKNGEYLGNSNNSYLVLCDVIDIKASKFEIHAETRLIGDEAFGLCASLTSLTLPKGISYIAMEAFNGCSSLKYNEYKNGKYLGSSDNPYLVLCGIINAKKTSFEIHADTKVISCAALYCCSSLKTLTIGNGVTDIGDAAFYDCSSLESVNYGGTKAQWASIEKGHEWNAYSGDYTVYCKDGNISN